MIEVSTPAQVEVGRTLNDRRSGSSRAIGRRANDGFLSRWFGRRRRRGIRDPRQTCCIVSVMVLVDRNLAIDGLMTGIGRRSILFRPASTYIFDRRGAEVSMRFAEYDVRGAISDVGTAGYVVLLAQPLTDETVEEIATRFGLGELPRRADHAPAGNA